MSTATEEDAAASSRWPDLPADLLRDVSGRLHAAADFVRFHAVCRPWRDSLPPAPRRPAFLPWLLTPRDAVRRRRGLCVLSSSSSSSSSTTSTRHRWAAAIAAGEVRVRERGWVIRTDDGTAVWLPLTRATPDPRGTGHLDPLTGAATAGSLPAAGSVDSWVARAAGSVATGGAVFLYTFVSWTLYAALLRPGDKTWTFVQWKDLLLHTTIHGDRCCVAYHGDGEIVLCHQSSWCIVSTTELDAADNGRLWRTMPDEPDRKTFSSYLVESQGELLWAFVQVKTKTSYYRNLRDCRASDAGTVASAVVVSVYALKEGEGGGGEPRWAKRDGRSLSGRVLFLGWPSSFSVEAARLGMGGGGFAYFVLNWYGLFRYAFHNDESEFVKHLPDEWNDEACMWLTPQPAIGTTERQEIRERLELFYRKLVVPQPQFGTCFKIYVGNLPPTVNNYRLRQFFSEHGMVIDARVICDKETGCSRGFGFVTMASQVYFEPADAIGSLRGLILDRRTLRVKLAYDQQRRSAPVFIHQPSWSMSCNG
ncbi:hypothetical protein ACP70R_004132 [Stipagrostis hirtigluma subsp. patula]